MKVLTRKSKRLDDVAVKVLVPKHLQIEGLTSQNLNSDAHKHRGWGVPAPFSRGFKSRTGWKFWFVVLIVPQQAPKQSLLPGIRWKLCQNFCEVYLSVFLCNIENNHSNFFVRNVVIYKVVLV